MATLLKIEEDQGLQTGDIVKWRGGFLPIAQHPVRWNVRKPNWFLKIFGGMVEGRNSYTDYPEDAMFIVFAVLAATVTMHRILPGEELDGKDISLNVRSDTDGFKKL